LLRPDRRLSKRQALAALNIGAFGSTPAPAPAPLATMLPKGDNDFTRLFAKLPRTATHEIAPTGPGEGPAAAGFAACLAALWLNQLGSTGQTAPIVWAREAAVAQEEGELYPPGLAGLGLPLDRLIVVNAKKRVDALWAAEEALKVKGAVAIAEIGPAGAPLDLTASRRLALSAAEHGSTALIVSHTKAHASSAAWTRWRIGAAPSSAPGRELGSPRFSVNLVRMRHALGERAWLLEWNADAKNFNAFMARDLAAAPADRPADQARASAG
jgi:protein ImuA